MTSTMVGVKSKRCRCGKVQPHSGAARQGPATFRGCEWQSDVLQTVHDITHVTLCVPMADKYQWLAKLWGGDNGVKCHDAFRSKRSHEFKGASARRSNCNRLHLHLPSLNELPSIAGLCRWNLDSVAATNNTCYQSRHRLGYSDTRTIMERACIRQ